MTINDKHFENMAIDDENYEVKEGGGDWRDMTDDEMYYRSQVQVGDVVKDPIDGVWRTVKGIMNNEVAMDNGGVMAFEECVNAEVMLPSEMVYQGMDIKVRVVKKKVLATRFAKTEDGSYYEMHGKATAIADCFNAIHIAANENLWARAVPTAEDEQGPTECIIEVYEDGGNPDTRTAKGYLRVLLGDEASA